MKTMVPNTHPAATLAGSSMTNDATANTLIPATGTQSPPTTPTGIGNDNTPGCCVGNTVS